MVEKEKPEVVDINKQIEVCGGIKNFDVNKYIEHYPIGQRCLTPEEYELLAKTERRPTPDDDNDPEYYNWLMQMIHKDNGGETVWHLNWDPEKFKTVYKDSEVPNELVWVIALLPSPTRKAKRARKWEQFRKDQEEMYKSWE